MPVTKKQDNSNAVVGWREWISLPDLGIQNIKAKIDTGARTSCLHAFFVETFQHQHRNYVRFGVHPEQKNAELAVICEAELLDLRMVSDSGGHLEERCVIRTSIVIGDRKEDIEITLTNRDSMHFRMLLGRTALNGYVVKPSESYLTRKRPSRKARLSQQ